MKKSIFKIIGWATVALIIPLLGNLFIDGWNWAWHDFVFAWVFWIIMAVSILLIARRFSKHRIVMGIIVFLIFASIWVMLATG